MNRSSESATPFHTDSYYAASAVGMTEYSPITGSESCDVCVIGGGFTGLSTSLNLAEKGYDVVLLEVNRIGWGASGRNGGQMGSGLNWSQSALEKEFGDGAARALWDLCEKAKQEVQGRITRHKIPCDFKHGVLGAAFTRKFERTYRDEVNHLRDRYDHHSVQFVEREEMRQMMGTDKYWAGMLDSSSGHLHPLNYAIGLANASIEAKVRIYENSQVVSYVRRSDRYEVTTRNDSIVRAKFIVFACNAYIGNVARKISRTIMPFVSCIVATEPLEEEVARSINRDDVAVFDSRFCLDYYRLSADRRLLFGGAEKYIPTGMGNIERVVRPRILHLYPKLKEIRIDYAWGGHIAVTRSRLPSVGRIDGDVYYAQGFSGHGVALTNIVGKILAEMISGTAEEFDLFASIPHKPFPGGHYLRWPAHVLTMLSLSLFDRLNARLGGIR